MAYITLSATLVQDPTRSRLLWIRTSTYVNDFLSVFERLDRKIFQSSCAIILQNKGGGAWDQKELCSNCIKEQYVHKEKSLDFDVPFSINSEKLPVLIYLSQ